MKNANGHQKFLKNRTFTVIYAENSISFSMTTAPFLQESCQML